MNILTDTLPSSVKIGNSIIDIETDFRAGVSFALMAEEGEEDIYKLFAPFFPRGFPANIVEAVEGALYFYRAGEKTDENAPKSSKRVYSFKIDSESIYADFWRFYGVDLSQDKLHWWTFRSLLFGLPEDSNFKQRIYYRTCDVKGLPKKEQKRILTIRKQIEIKTAEKGGKITLEQRNKQMIDYVSKRNKELRG